MLLSTDSSLRLRHMNEFDTSANSSSEEIEETSPFFPSKKKVFKLEINNLQRKMNIKYRKIQLSDDDEKHHDYDRRGYFAKFIDFILRRKKHFARTVFIDGTTYPEHQKYPPNVVKNQKYNIITFLPFTLYEQFKFFFNLYFLIVALTQFFPPLKVGFLFTYVAPLAFVLSVTLLKEAYDDIKRWRRDVEANSQKYEILTHEGFKTIPSSKLKVGHLVRIKTNQRVPADCILLRTTEKTGASFIRTDQLDGETDWKLRHAVPACQKLPSDYHLLQLNAAVYAEPPRKEIYDFLGTFTIYEGDQKKEVDSLSLENTLWSNTVVASGTVIGLVIYTGSETRSVMNTSNPASKVGKLDLELNTFSKLLFILMAVLSFIMVALQLFRGNWGITLFRFFLLFSSIIPISMRVNLDMGKTLYSYLIMRDKNIPGTIVRNSSIPEELGRIEFLFSDKTGTLTQNDMVFKKLHLGRIHFAQDTLSDIEDFLKQAYQKPQEKERNSPKILVKRMMEAIALCHNVTPVIEDGKKEYQASSPDEVALVKFAESVGIILEDRTLNTITIKHITGKLETFDILQIFPFTSETKRMGIIVKSRETGIISFYAKGADAIMTKLVKFSDWLSEECDNLAREGLRTLVFGKKVLSQEEYDKWAEEYKIAKATIQDRAQNVLNVRAKLEKDMDLIGLTGVEDKLQPDVQASLENLRNAGIKVWMLTGDKVETATCIGRSSKLIARDQQIFYLLGREIDEVEAQLEEFASTTGTCLILDGTTLQICLDHLKDKFIKYAQKAPSVICCRCAPTQKAEIVKIMKKATKKRVAAIGDGGNDVSMIQAANVGLGIVGKEGKHASLAADFSINQFSYCTRLLLWHGRNSYKRSARLSQFVIHRGLIISFIQAVFSAVYYYAAIPIYTGWLLVGYATFYTMLPVFAIVLDEDVKEKVVFMFPELYKDLQKGRSLNFKTFLEWVFKAVYQGGLILLLAIFLFENSFLRIVSITFTALILTELLMVILEVHRVNIWMVLAVIVSIITYTVSIFLLPSYFDIPFILTGGFWLKVAIIVLCSCLPIYIVKFIRKRCNPPAYAKLS